MQKTHCKKGHPLIFPNIKYNGEGFRQCRTCANKRNRDRERKTMTIFWTAKLKLPNEKAFNEFIQKMANRVMQGHCRYGSPDKSKKYMTRLGLEFKAYKRTGNAEHLINIANYCHLEMYASENKKFHFDNSIESITRNIVS